MKTSVADAAGHLQEVDLYRVGLLRDLHILKNNFVNAPDGRWRRLRYRLGLMARDMVSLRRNYWNGWLAEPTNPHGCGCHTGKCGHGWTRKRALAKLSLYWETARWARHRCGLLRRICGEPGMKFFCMDCSVSDSDWREG